MGDAPKGLGQRALKVVAVVVGLIAFVVGKQFVQTWHKQKSEQEQGAHVAAYWDKMRTEAVKEKPDQPIGEAMEEKAKKDATAQLKALSGDKKVQSAANMYVGFFLMNTKAMPTFCKEQGVAIPAWTAAFEKVNATETARARQIHARTGFDEDRFYALIVDQYKKLVADDMHDIAATNKISLKDACKRLQDHADDLAADMSLSNVQPDVYKALMIP